MGFSVSGSAAIIFLGFLAAFGMVYTAASNGYEQVTDANQRSQEALLDQQNTDIEITNLTFVNDDTLHIHVNNTGSTSLVVNDTDILVDNEYLTEFDYKRVDGDPGRDLWLPGEELHLKYTYPTNQSNPPEHVRIVSGPGVADSGVV